MEKNKTLEVGDLLNMDFFTNNPPPLVIADSDAIPKPKRQRKKTTKTEKLPDGTEIILADQEDDSQLAMYQSNEPYINSYNETNMMLKSSVAQIDILQNDIKGELDQVRASKTLKRKYDYMSMMSSTLSQLISTKVGAVKELNKVITDSHNLEIKRIKDLKIGATTEEVNDDRHIMQLYESFINTPVGTYGGFGAPPIAEMTAGNVPGLQRVDMLHGDGNDVRFNNYMNNLSPAQNMMLLESNPNIDTVVIYNSDTGHRRFAVIDTATGSEVPNVPIPDESFLADTTIDIARGICINTNLDKSYKLITIGGSSSISEY